MDTLKQTENRIKLFTIATTILFFCCAAVYFFLPKTSYNTAIPVGLLALTSVLACPWQMTIAFIFSAAGDYFGSCGNFMAQMGCFAVSHFFFITFFASHLIKKVKADKKANSIVKRLAAITTICAAIISAVAFIVVVPKAPTLLLQIGVSIYTCLICTMLILATLQRSWIFSIGAILFVTSDFILAWNMFVTPVPGSKYLIMVPYFTAQWMLYIKSASLRESRNEAER